MPSIPRRLFVVRHTVTTRPWSLIMIPYHCEILVSVLQYSFLVHAVPTVDRNRATSTSRSVTIAELRRNSLRGVFETCWCRKSCRLHDNMSVAGGMPTFFWPRDTRGPRRIQYRRLQQRKLRTLPQQACSTLIFQYKTKPCMSLHSLIGKCSPFSCQGRRGAQRTK